MSESRIFMVIFHDMLARHSLTRRRLLATAGVSLGISSRAFAIDSRVRFKAKTLDGDAYSTESVRGKIVLVQFWATWCPCCKSDAPAVDAVLRNFGDQGLVVLAVDVGESKKTVTSFLARSPRNCKIVLLPDTNLAAWFDPKTFPAYAVIDRDGIQAGQQNGAGGERALRHLLRKAGLHWDDSDVPDDLQSSPRRV